MASVLAPSLQERQPRADSPALDCDVAIVGGGIVGATLACALADSGLRVAIVEAKTHAEAAARDRAYAFSLLSGRIMAGLGIWEEIFPALGKFDRIHLSDSNRPGAVKFDPSEVRSPDYLGYAAPHGPVLRALQRRSQEASNVRWHCPAQVREIMWETDAAVLHLDMAGEAQTLRSLLVVGADGPRSRIREAAGISTRGWQYEQACVTTTFEHELPNHAAFERFWPTGPMGVLPLSERRCQVVWTLPRARADAMRDLDEAEFVAQLEHHTGGLLGKIRLTGERLVFPVQLRQSDRYVRSRLALVGDAAHCCHPVGGQGLNQGIRDAAALAQTLISAHQRGEDVGQVRVLRRYERWRKWENLVILGFTDFLNRTFSNQLLPLVLLRRFGLLLLRRVRLFRFLALALMTGLLGRRPELARRSSNS